MSRILPLLLAVGAALLVTPSAGAGGQAGYGCPPTFHSYTITDTLSLPRIQAGLDEGIYTEADVLAVLGAINHNGNDAVCVQIVPAGNSSVVPAPWQYHYNIVDDNASVPTR